MMLNAWLWQHVDLLGRRRRKMLCSTPVNVFDAVENIQGAPNENLDLYCCRWECFTWEEQSVANL